MSEIHTAVRVLLRAQYPEQHREVIPDSTWLVTQGHASAVVSAADSDQGYSYARVIVPLALEVRPSTALDSYLARIARRYEMGRFFLCDSADYQSAMVVVEEFIPGIVVEGLNPGGMKFIWSVIVSLLNMFDDPGAGGHIRETFGGRALNQETEALLPTMI